MHFIPSSLEKSILAQQVVDSRAYALLLILATPAVADDWPLFRGPNYSGVSAERGWTTNWPTSGPRAAWRADVGIRASSVVTVGNRVITIR